MLPDSDEMKEEIARMKERMKRFVESDRHTIQIDYLPYIDDIAGKNWLQIESV